MLTVLCGPARGGKTERLLGRYRAALSAGSLGGTLWLAPTWRAADTVRERLFDAPGGNGGDPVPPFPGCFQPNVMTFAKFADATLRSAGVVVHRVTRAMKRDLIGRILAEQASAGRLRHFASIAATGGLVDLVCDFIRELKRLEIWPEDFHRACSERGIGDRDVELSEIYTAYQDELREHGLFDAEGCFWSARDELQKSAPAFRLVMVDGFTDFTRTQHEILEILARGADEMLVTLPLEAAPRREDLFAKPLKTLAELRRRHSDLDVEEILRGTHVGWALPTTGDLVGGAHPTRNWPAMEHLERMLFVDPRGTRGGGRKSGEEANCEPPVAGIEILAAARQLGEIDMVGARIKRLLADGHARPGEIAVVFRSLSEVGGLVQEVFGRLGIPFVSETGDRLDRSPALRALAGLLHLDADDWPFSDVLAVLGGNYFQPAWPEWQGGRAAAAVERKVRELQIPSGRARLLAELVSNLSSPPDEQAACGFAAGATTGRGFVDAHVASVVRRLADAFDAMPERATLPEWAEAWQRLARETGLLRAMGEEAARESLHSTLDSRPSTSSPVPRPPPPAPFVSNRRAWARLMEVLEAGDTLAGWLKQRPRALDRGAAFEAFLDILGDESVGHAGDESGCVRLLSAPSIRSLRIRHLFLAGLSEKAFPPPQHDDGIYSESEYARLIDAGLPLVGRSERTREEMLLFYEAATRATERLYLSYPALDEAAQPLLPSPFLQEVEQAFGSGRLPRVERADLSPIPLDDEPLCAAEYRVKAMATALAGNVALLAGLMGADGEVVSGQWPAVSEDTTCQPTNLQISKCPNLPIQRPLSESLAAGLEITSLRQDRGRFGPAEGALQGAAVKEELAKRFAADRVFGVTELERYASCPFRFFLEKVLRVEPLDDLTLEFDVMERGSIVHKALAVFHENVKSRLGRPASPLELDAAEFDALMAESIAASFEAAPSNPLQAALREVDRRLIVEWLARYREQCEKYAGLWKDYEKPFSPEFFEKSFGRGELPPLEFVREGHAVRLSGRIDRVDTGVAAGREIFNVLDYKTGGSISFSAESIAAGATLQLPLYALAAMELLLTDRDMLPWQAGYWYVRDAGFRPRQTLCMYRNDDGRIELDPEWEHIRAGLGDTVVALARGIRRGQFPVCSADERCTGRCPFATVCRIQQVRSLEKTCQPATSK